MNYIVNSLQNALLQVLLRMIGKLIQIKLNMFCFSLNLFDVILSVCLSLLGTFPTAPRAPSAGLANPKEGTKASGFGAGQMMRMMFCRIDLD